MAAYYEVELREDLKLAWISSRASKMASKMRTLVLLVLLCILLVVVWIRDRPNPAAPQGEFLSIILFAGLIVCLTLV